jgi:anti-sigma regulatory factor (Ser/Thr protein kinase)
MNDATPDSRTPVSLGKLSVPVEMAYLRHTLAYTAETAKMLSFDEVGVSMLELAVEEAFTNAVKHFSKTPGADENIHVEFSLNGADFIISIRDRGIPFDIDEVESYEASDASDADKPGLGMTLMKKSVDKVEVISGSSSGKEVRLIKRIPAGAALPEFLRRHDGPTRAKRRSIDINTVIIRQPTVDDLPSIRRLTWRSYGYHYVSQFYDMKKLRAMFESPCYLPAIAVDPETKEALFHIALELESPNDTVPEEGMAFLDPTIRCPGLTSKVSEFLHAIAKQKGFHGIRAETVTTHTQSQKGLAEAYGTIPCAVLLACGKADFVPSDLPIAVQNRVTEITHYCVMDRTPAAVYVPARHARMISEIYGWMDMPRTFMAASPSELPELSKMQDVPSVEMNRFKINVTTIGKDCVDQIRAKMDEARKNGFEAIYLKLPLDTPATASIADECEKMGLFFAGVVPFALQGRDALVLQWVGVPLDMDAIKIYGDKGRVLFDYVKKCAGY